MSGTTRPRFAPGARRRHAAVRSPDSLAHERPIAEGQALPWLIEAAGPEVVLDEWVARQRDRIDDLLVQHGALLFRGFGVCDAPTMARAVAAISGEILPYYERTGPRSHFEAHIYTSTDYPPEYEIFLHNENSYSRRIPGRLFFSCFVPPAARGETPLADCRAVERRIDPSVRDRFLESGWMHVRNIAPELGPGWRDVFQRETREEVERYCGDNGIALEWLGAERLRTTQVHDVHVTHPVTGERLWCNHATFYHAESLEPRLRGALGADRGTDHLPNHTRFGDGTEIRREDIHHLQAAYLAEKRTFAWQRGDLLLVDNLRVCHGREPYEGDRSIAVAMTTPFDRAPSRAASVVLGDGASHPAPDDPSSR